MKLLFIFKKNKGLSLVEVTLGAALMGALALGIMQVQTISTNQEKKSSQQFETLSLGQSFQQGLRKPSRCLENFCNILNNGSCSSNFTINKNSSKSVGANKLPNLKIGTSSISPGSTLGLIHFTDQSLSLSRGELDQARGDLKINFTFGNDPTAKEISIPVTFSIDPATNKLIGCNDHAAQAGANCSNFDGENSNGKCQDIQLYGAVQLQGNLSGGNVTGANLKSSVDGNGFPSFTDLTISGNITTSNWSVDGLKLKGVKIQNSSIIETAELKNNTFIGNHNLQGRILIDGEDGATIKGGTLKKTNLKEADLKLFPNLLDGVQNNTSKSFDKFIFVDKDNVRYKLKYTCEDYITEVRVPGNSTARIIENKVQSYRLFEGDGDLEVGPSSDYPAFKPHHSSYHIYWYNGEVNDREVSCLTYDPNNPTEAPSIGTPAPGSTWLPFKRASSWCEPECWTNKNRDARVADHKISLVWNGLDEDEIAAGYETGQCMIENMFDHPGNNACDQYMRLKCITSRQLNVSADQGTTRKDGRFCFLTFVAAD